MARRKHRWDNRINHGRARPLIIASEQAYRAGAPPASQEEIMRDDESSKKSSAPSPAGKVDISWRQLLGCTSLIAALAVAATALPRTAASQDTNVLPRPEPPFRGKIERTLQGSVPDFPKGVEAPAGAPNVLLILTDDVGFGATSVFGGPIQTPNFQRIADRGLRYNMYHTTALCSPTRAAL